MLVNETIYNRENFEVKHTDNLKLNLTTFTPEYNNNAIFLYLHGNSSSKLESMSIVRFLPKEFAIAAFDFIGCGKNQERDSISLGYR